MTLFIVKIAVTILVVVVIAEISKRVTPRLGGLLLGLPLGVGLAVYFIAYSEGVPFMVESIPWGLAGLAPAVVFCSFYLLGGRIFRVKNRIASILLCSLTGIAAFGAAGYLLSLLDIGLVPALLIFLAVYAANIAILRRQARRQPVKPAGGGANAIVTFLIRGLISGVILAAVTGAASFVGNQWAGVLSAFPSTTYTLLVVLHFEEGDALYPFIVYGFTYSVSTLALFYILCWALLPALGLNLGFLVTYVICLAYLYVVKLVSDRMQGRPAEAAGAPAEDAEEQI